MGTVISRQGHRHECRGEAAKPAVRPSARPPRSPPRSRTPSVIRHAWTGLSRLAPTGVDVRHRKVPRPRRSTNAAAASPPIARRDATPATEKSSPAAAIRHQRWAHVAGRDGRRALRCQCPMPTNVPAVPLAWRRRQPCEACVEALALTTLRHSSVGARRVVAARQALSGRDDCRHHSR